MPIEKEKEKVQKTVTETTKWYVCDVPSCGNRAPHDEFEDEIDNTDVEIPIHTVMLNPEVEQFRTKHMPPIRADTLVLVCEKHIDRVGELLRGSLNTR